MSWTDVLIFSLGCLLAGGLALGSTYLWEWIFKRVKRPRRVR